ncbi:glycosyltransferase family 2 protein [Nocardioides sp. PD653]|uniref:glycosyltransferase family 2 protein n=2 Tax=unclassified Nocardioides TaxID=2615069 RepID=UPI001F621232|nr:MULTISPECIES: glycosyltransferase [unclassified Nocardioides]
MSPLVHEIIICTRNRPDDLRRAVATVGLQSVRPLILTVVDSSDDGGAAVCEILREADSESGPTVRFVHTTPGLPHQRNLGIERAQGDIVHFIDDDVILHPEYCAELGALFDLQGDSLIGAGGLIESHGTRNPRLWWRLGLLDSRRQGVVLPSGVSVIVTHADEPLNVQWLSGCSMSFRRSLFELERFDDDLPGYALMEDVDFSWRASLHGSLMITPAATLVHNVSAVERWDFEQRTRAGVYRRGWFVEKHLGSRGRFAFAWSVMAGIVISSVLAVVTLSRWRLRIAWWTAKGLSDFVRGTR